jgi:medium-chain acyl-[acyl-carrier-protein] hydrolase
MSAPLTRIFRRCGATEPRARVFCFPHSGGTAAAFKQLGQVLPEGLELCAFEPPGREARAAEPFAKTMDELLAPVLTHAHALFDRPYVLLGHSLGTWMAFELARKLQKTSVRTARALVLAGCRAPHVARRPPLSQLDRHDLLEELRRMNGTPREVLDADHLMALLLPRIRADFALGERYQLADEPPLDVPVHVLGGLEDPTARPAQLSAWRSLCTGPFELTLLPGDHFFVTAQSRALAKLLARVLEPSRAPDLQLTASQPT